MYVMTLPADAVELRTGCSKYNRLQERAVAKLKAGKTIDFQGEGAVSEMVTIQELRQMREEGRAIRLLDVRTMGEFGASHIQGSHNVPLDSLNKYADELCECVDTPIIIVCQSGQRAKRAFNALSGLGMKNVAVLDGGVSKWSAAGYELEHGAERLSLERQVRIAAGTLAAVGGFLGVFVNPLFALIPGFVGSGLIFAGLTNTCGMGMALSRLSYNRPAGCDVDAMVRALKEGPETAAN